MRRIEGLLLEDREILLADYLIRHGVKYLQTLNGGAVDSRMIALRDRLAAEAGRQSVAVVVDRGSTPAQASGRRGNAETAGVVVVEDSRPEMTTAQVAARLGITARSVRNLCHSGDLLGRLDPAGRWTIDADSATALAARRKREARNG